MPTKNEFCNLASYSSVRKKRACYWLFPNVLNFPVNFWEIRNHVTGVFRFESGNCMAFCLSVCVTTRAPSKPENNLNLLNNGFKDAVLCATWTLVLHTKAYTRVKTTNLKISVYPYNYDIITYTCHYSIHTFSDWWWRFFNRLFSYTPSTLHWVSISDRNYLSSHSSMRLCHKITQESLYHSRLCNLVTFRF